jgi:hypothetical protein
MSCGEWLVTRNGWLVKEAEILNFEFWILDEQRMKNHFNAF